MSKGKGNNFGGGNCKREVHTWIIHEVDPNYRIVILGPVVQKPINANPWLKINQGVYFFTPKYCSTLIFAKTLHQRNSILKKTKISQKVENTKPKFMLIQE